jgi:hypothetical protein
MKVFVPRGTAGWVDSDEPLLCEKKTKALEDYVARCVSRPARAQAAAKDQNLV